MELISSVDMPRDMNQTTLIQCRNSADRPLFYFIYTILNLNNIFKKIV